MSVVLYDKYQKSDLNKVMKNQRQHLIETQRKELLKFMQKFKELFDGTLGTWKVDTVDW